MRQSALFRGRIEGGEVKFRGVDGARWAKLKTHLEGQEVDITLDRHAAKRSGAQNRYYWGVVVKMIAEAMGELCQESAHDALRVQFLRVPAVEGKLPTIRSTTDLTTAEFEDYLMRCKVLASKMFNIYIPDPNEVPED